MVELALRGVAFSMVARSTSRDFFKQRTRYSELNETKLLLRQPQSTVKSCGSVAAVQSRTRHDVHDAALLIVS